MRRVGCVRYLEHMQYGNLKPALLASAALCVSTFLGGLRADAQTVDNHQLANQLVGQFIAAQNTMNADLFDGVFTPNYIQHSAGVAPGLKSVLWSRR